MSDEGPYSIKRVDPPSPDTVPFDPAVVQYYEVKGPGLKSEDIELIESLLTPDWQRWEAEIRRLNTAYRAGLRDAKKK